MPITECISCGGKHNWSWEEAFDKFGFNDGDGQVETWQVEVVLRDNGYSVEVQKWGFHNTIIISIKRGTREGMPVDDPEVTIGYDDPRSYLPDEVVALLDNELADVQSPA